MPNTDLIVRISGDTSAFVAAMRGVNAELATAGGGAVSAAARFSSMSDTMKGLSIAITAPIVGLGAASIRAAGQMEQAQTAFTTMLGSGQKAQVFLRDLQQFAAKTPFEFRDLTDAAKRMMALGFASSEVLPTLRRVGDAAGALGLGAEGVNRIVLALGQMKAKGQVQAEEMRQLAEAGIPAWDALAKKLGTDVPTAMKLVEQRAVDASTAIAAVMETINQRFGGGMEAQSKTLLGLISNTKDALFVTLADLGSAMLPAAKSIVENFVNPSLAGLRDLAAAFRALPSAVQSVTLAVTGLAAALPIALLAFAKLAEWGARSGAVFASIATFLSTTGGSLLAWLGTALPASIGAASMSLGGLIALGGVWAAAVGTTIYVMGQLVSVFKQYRDAMAAQDAAQKSEADTQALLIVKLRQAGAPVNQLIADLKSGLVTHAQFNEQLREMASRFAHVATGAGAAEQKLGDLTKKTFTELSEALKRETAELQRAEAAFLQNKITLGEVTKQRELVKKLSAALKVELKAEADEWKNLGTAVQGPLPYLEAVNEALGKIATRDAAAPINVLAEAIARVSEAAPEYTAVLTDYAQGLSDAGIGGEKAATSIKRYADALVALHEAAQPALDDVWGLNQALNPTGLQFPGDATKLPAPPTAAYESPFNFPDYAKYTQQAAEYATEFERIERDYQIGGLGVDEYEAALDALAKKYPEVAKQATDMGVKAHAAGADASRGLQAVSTIMTDLSRGLAQAMVEWEGFGELGVNIAKNIATAFLRYVIEGAFKALARSISDAMSQLDGLGGALGKIFGSLGGSAAGSAGSAAGSAGGGASSAASSAGEGVSGVTNMVTGIGSLVSGIIGNFQMAGMNKSLDIIVSHTLQAAMTLRSIEDFLRQILNGIHDRLVEFRTAGIGVYPQSGYSWATAPAAGSTGVGGITLQVNGGYFMSPRAMDDFFGMFVDYLRLKGVNL